MVKIFYLTVLYRTDSNEVKRLRAASDLSSFGFFQRNSVSEFMRFTSKIIVERSTIPSRVTVKEEPYNCHVYIRNNRLSGIIISDLEYPPRVAHNLLTKILDEFSDEVAPSLWPTLAEDSANYLKLDGYLAKFQNPKEADTMTKLQEDLDETKDILHKTITQVLERGEKLENLVAKSDELSAQSKMFYKTARKTNQCCQYI